MSKQQPTFIFHQCVPEVKDGVDLQSADALAGTGVVASAVAVRLLLKRALHKQDIQVKGLKRSSRMVDTVGVMSYSPGLLTEAINLIDSRTSWFRADLFGPEEECMML